MAAAAFFDRILETTTTTGVGTLTLAGAVAGYQTFGAVGNANTTPMAVWEVDANGNPSGAWETATDCTFTSSGTTLTRGTFLASSTGSAVSFAAGTKQVAQVLPAGLMNQANWTYAAAGADAAPAMAVNTFYTADISGYSADRTATLPAVAAVGDRICIYITTGDSLYELLLTAAAGDTLNGVAGGTEWSRLFITGEGVIVRCIVANTTWIVEYDGRIPQQALMRLSTSASAEVLGTLTQPTAKSGVWTADIDNASITTVASDQIKTRRAGNFAFTLMGTSTSNVTVAKYFRVYAYKNGTTTQIAAFGQPLGATAQGRSSGSQILPFVVDDYIVYQFASEEGSKGLLSGAAPTIYTSFSMIEVL